MIAVACHARAADHAYAVTRRASGRARPRRGRDLGEFVVFARRHGLILATFTLLGAFIGGGLAVTSPTSYAARTTVLMSRAPIYVDTQGLHAPPAVTIDTDAQLYLAPVVAKEVSKRTAVPAPDVASRLLITAAPLSRVLSITFQGRTPEIAREGAQVAAEAMLSERRRVLVAQSTRRLGDVRVSLASLQSSALRTQVQGGASDAYTAKLADRIGVLSALSAQLEDVDRSPGQVIVSAHVVRTEKARAVTTWVGSGAGLAFLLALAVAYLRPPGGWFAVLRRRRSIPRVWDVPSVRPR
jgi:hypothetical protein